MSRPDHEGLARRWRWIETAYTARRSDFRPKVMIHQLRRRWLRASPVIRDSCCGAAGQRRSTFNCSNQAAMENQMPAWLRNERVDFWVAVFIGVIIGSSPVIFVPIVENLLPGVVWWPGAWLVCTGVALIAWHLRKES